jgi:hypothetical protein
MRLPRSAFLFFRVEEYTGMFSGPTQDKAIELIDTTDKARAAFVRQYLGRQWQEPHLYHAMFNTEMGESCTATMLVECLQLFQRD